MAGGGGPANDFVGTRLNSDGSVDRGYGGEGTAIADFGEQERVYAAALQPDGKLIVAGESNSTTASHMAVARFTAAGKLDPTFDPGRPDGDGKKLFPVTSDGPPLRAVAVLVQPDGRIVLAGPGPGPASSMGVTRLTDAGSVAGDRYPEQSRSEIALARFDSDGKLDKSFDGDGKAGLGSSREEDVQDVLVQPDGRVVVAGTSRSPGYDMATTRFKSDGTPDTSWGGDGRAFAELDGGSQTGASALQPDGRFVVAGISVEGLDGPRRT